MRENMGLYRGKRLDNKEWVSGGSIIQFLDDDVRTVYIPQFNEKCTTSEDEAGNLLSFESGVFYKVDPDTVGEFSGRMFDDKKAFEGDIFHIPGDECDVMITWDEYASAFMAVGTKDGEHIWLSDYAEDDMFWIGTKWDNPELLEAAP